MIERTGPDIINRLNWWIKDELEAGRKSAMEDAAYDIEDMRGLLEEIKNSVLCSYPFNEGNGDRNWWRDWNKRADAVIDRTANPAVTVAPLAARKVDELVGHPNSNKQEEK